MRCSGGLGPRIHGLDGDGPYSAERFAEIYNQGERVNLVTGAADVIHRSASGSEAGPRAAGRRVEPPRMKSETISPWTLASTCR